MQRTLQLDTAADNADRGLSAARPAAASAGGRAAPAPGAAAAIRRPTLGSGRSAISVPPTRAEHFVDLVRGRGREAAVPSGGRDRAATKSRPLSRSIHRCSFLWQVTDRLPRDAGSAEDADSTGGRPHQAEDGAHQRGLAGPVGPEHADELAGRDL